MDTDAQTQSASKITQPLTGPSSAKKLLLVTMAASLILGSLTGYILATKKQPSSVSSLIGSAPKTAQQDNKTFRDFAEGTIKKKPASNNEYGEGTHMLERTGADSVALTSSVVDLDQYIGKKVKVLGETQKALKEGWLMDVGKVEEIH